MSKKLTGVLFALLLATAFAACGDDDGDVDFRSHNTNYSVLVRNNTSERLVAFKGDLRRDTLIGGVPARAENHGLPNNLALFDKTESFPLILLTEAQYRANINNLNSQRNTPFTRVFVFFNRQGDNTVVYELSDRLGGNNQLKIINSSVSVNVELRLGGVAGETIGFAPAGILETTLRLHDGDFYIFPVFRRYNQSRDLVETVYPKGTGSGGAWFQHHTFGEGIDSLTMNLKELLQSATFVSGATWVRVDNQTTSGSVRFMEGPIVRRTATGLEGIVTSRTFQIDMPKLPNGSYADTLQVHNWRFGRVGEERALQAGEHDSTPLASLTLDRDKMYIVTVAGDANAGNLKAWISSIEDIPTGELGGTW
jgi:hypothetical protein